MKKGIYINDAIHGLIALTEYERRIVSTIGFNRLHDVYQNSTVYLTFPSNRTKRFEHSIGTMKLCSDMFYQSLLNSSEDMLTEFFSMFQEEFNEIVSQIRTQPELCKDKLNGIPPQNMPQVSLDQLRHSLIPNNIAGNYQTTHLILIQAIRAAALLHDIGHPPFSHIVEYALRDVYMEYKDKKDLTNPNAKEFITIMSSYFEGNKKLHEQMGDEISEGILSKIIKPLTDEKEYDENLFDLLVLESVKKIFAEEGAFSYLHRIIDSSLDGDRLDYVTRDVLSSGKDAGRIEYSRIINDMKMIVKDHAIYFCVPIKAVTAVEDFVKRRYNSYKDIIYHNNVIKTDFILEGIVKDLVIQYLNEPAENKGGDNEVLIPFNISGLWFPLGDKKSTIKANALSQWNDSWLLTLFRQIYYTKYYHNDSIEEGTREYVLYQRLAELLRNSKRYHSLIKRGENFKLIDDAVKEELKKAHIERKENSSGFILSYIAKNKEVLHFPDFEQFVSRIVKEQTKQVVTNIRTYETVTLFRRISLGLDAPIYLYNHKNTICKLTDISGIADILQLDAEYLPVFYIYILAKDGEGVLKEKREELLTRIGQQIGKEIVLRISSTEKKDF